MSEKQSCAVRAILTAHYAAGAREFHHGDCVGADAEAHAIARDIGYSVHVHPPENRSFRAYCYGDVNSEPDTYMNRNKAIVGASTIMVGCPASETREQRSGTAATMAYSLSVGVPVVMVAPSGNSNIPKGFLLTPDSVVL